MKNAFAATFMALAAGAVGLPAFAAATVGQPAPAFSVVDAAGKTVSLADFKGKHVVLEWVNPGCPFVQKHYNSANMQGTQKDATAKGVVWLAINSTAPDAGDYKAPAAMAQWMQSQKAALRLLDQVFQRRVVRLDSAFRQRPGAAWSASELGG